jgi:hypothetical protein
MLAHSLKPAGNGGFTMHRAAHEDREITPFRQGPSKLKQSDLHQSSVDKGVCKAAGEALVAPLAFPILNVIMDTTFSIADNGVQAVICDTEVIAQRIGAGEALGGEMFGATACTFQL